MTSRSISASLLASTAVLLSSYSHEAAAYVQDDCGPASTATFQIDRGFTPVGSTENEPITYSVAFWNFPSGMADRLASTGGDSNATFDNTANRFEIGLVPNGHGSLAGLAGHMWGSLSWSGGCNRLTSGSIAVDQSYSGASTNELDASMTRREITLHEFGHALGLGHETQYLSIMADGATAGRVGSEDRNGGWFDRTVSLFPDNTDFMVNVHPSSSTGRQDPMVSPWGRVSGNDAHLLHGIGGQFVSMCRFQSGSVLTTVGNLGKVNISNAGIRIVFSTDDSISIADTTAGTGTFWATVGADVTLSVGFVVPNLPNGLYRVGSIVDPTNAITEDTEGNNACLTGLFVNIVC